MLCMRVVVARRSAQDSDMAWQGIDMFAERSAACGSPPTRTGDGVIAVDKYSE